MFRFIMIVAFFTFLNAGEDLLGESPDKIIDLNKPVKLYLLYNIPGRLSSDGMTFTTVHGIPYTCDGIRAVSLVELPFWLSQRPSKATQAVMSPEQLAFWKALSDEVTVWGPLRSESSRLYARLNSAMSSRDTILEALDKEVAKARENHDKGALGPTASATRQARRERALAAVESAQKAVKAFEDSGNRAVLRESENRLIRLWETKLPKPVNSESKNP